MSLYLSLSLSLSLILSFFSLLFLLFSFVLEFFVSLDKKQSFSLTYLPRKHLSANWSRVEMNPTKIVLSKRFLFYLFFIRTFEFDLIYYRGLGGAATAADQNQMQDLHLSLKHTHTHAHTHTHVILYLCLNFFSLTLLFLSLHI